MLGYFCYDLALFYPAQEAGTIYSLLRGPAFKKLGQAKATSGFHEHNPIDHNNGSSNIGVWRQFMSPCWGVCLVYLKIDFQYEVGHGISTLNSGVRVRIELMKSMSYYEHLLLPHLTHKRKLTITRIRGRAFSWTCDHWDPYAIPLEALPTLLATRQTIKAAVLDPDQRIWCFYNA